MIIYKENMCRYKNEWSPTNQYTSGGATTEHNSKCKQMIYSAYLSI